MLVTPNLKGWWRFEGNANDNSGNGNDGTVYGAVLADGKFGQCYSFDGINDKITTNGQPVTGTDPISTSLWFKTSSSDDQTLFQWGGTSTNNAGTLYSLSIENGVIFLRTCAKRIAEWGSGYNDGSWHHLALTHPEEANVSDVNCYIDGQEISRSFLGVNDGLLNIGTDKNLTIGTGLMGYFDGLIDELMAFEAELSQPDIKRIMMGFHPLGG